MPTIRRTARPQPRTAPDRWQTALTSIAPNTILIRGYAVDEMMGRLSFADAVYLLLMGELPSPAIGRMLNAVLVSSLDHGVTPPSTLAARNVATSGAPLKDCVAAGILAFGPHHGGDIESCMRFLDTRAGAGARRRVDASRRPSALVDDCVKRRPDAAGLRPSLSHARSARRAAVPDGAGARARRRARPDDPRDRARARGAAGADRPARCRSTSTARSRPSRADLGFAYDLGNAIFLISRLPGLIAHAHEERARQTPMRQIDPKDHDYDGSRDAAVARDAEVGQWR